MKNVKVRHIEVVTNSFYPNIAGMEKNIYETYKVLANKGWMINIHTSRHSLSEKNVLPTKEKIGAITVNRYNSNKLGFIPRIDWKNSDILSIHGYTFTSYSLLIFMAALSKKISGKPIIVLTPHGILTPNWNWYSKAYSFFLKIVHPTIGTFLINSLVDGVRCVSEWEREGLKKLGIKESLLVTIKNGIENEAFNLSSNQDKNSDDISYDYIIQVGRISPEKNYEIVIRALPYIEKNIKFLIVGPIQNLNYKDYLIKLAHRTGVKERVIFYGIVEGIKKYKILKKAKAMVHMAKWESFCNVVHEGMSQGLVCVVSNTTALPYLVKNGINGFTLDPEDSKGVADKINYILDNYNSSEIKKMRETNKNSTVKHTWENVALEVENYYESVMKNR